MTWLSTKEVAELLCISRQAVVKNANNRKYGSKVRYIDGKGRGGKVLQISLSALPSHVQNIYLSKDTNIPITAIPEYDTHTKGQQQKGEQRAHIVQQYRKYEKQRMGEGTNSLTVIKNEFITKWNNDNPNEVISLPSLYRWLSKSKKGDPTKLVDRRGGHNRGQSSISDDVWELFCKYYLRESKPTITSCYDLVALEYRRKGIMIPKLRAFEYKVKQLPKSVVTLTRDGIKAFEDSCVPYAERDYTTLEVNDLWVSDHHLWDVHVLVPSKDGYRKVRPWGSYWMDMRSKKITSNLLRAEPPNSDAVLCSFGNGLKENGIPKAVYLDNGKDYKALDLFNTDKERRQVSTLAEHLQLDVHYAIPYNAKAKPLERTFNTFESQFSKLFKTYLGRNPVERPKNLNDLSLEDYPTLEEFKKLHDDYFEEFYNNDSHSGEEMYERTPNEVFSKNLISKRVVSDEVLRLCLMRSDRPRKVHRNGITLNASHFYTSELALLIGEKVYARYNPDNPDVAYIYDLNDNPLYVAHKVQKMSFDPTQEEYHELNKRKAEARKLIKEQCPEHDEYIGSVEHIAHLMELKKQENKEKQKPKRDVPAILEPIRNVKLEEAAKRFSMSHVEQIKNDALIQQQKQEQNHKTNHMDTITNLSKYYENLKNVR